MKVKETIALTKESLKSSLNFKSTDQISTIQWNKGVTRHVDPYLYISLSEQYWTAHSRSCSCLSWRLFDRILKSTCRSKESTGTYIFGNFDHFISEIECQTFVAKMEKKSWCQKVIKLWNCWRLKYFHAFFGLNLAIWSDSNNATNFLWLTSLTLSEASYY